jgi:hypothetical protein
MALLEGQGVALLPDIYNNIAVLRMRNRETDLARTFFHKAEEQVALYCRDRGPVAARGYLLTILFNRALFHHGTH